MVLDRDDHHGEEGNPRRRRRDNEPRANEFAEDCVIRPARIATVSDAQIRRRIGTISPKDRNAVSGSAEAVSSMTAAPQSPAVPADAVPQTWVDQAPGAVQPYLRLMRLDRPIGTWLLYLAVRVRAGHGRVRRPATASAAAATSNCCAVRASAPSSCAAPAAPITTSWTAISTRQGRAHAGPADSLRRGERQGGVGVPRGAMPGRARDPAAAQPVLGRAGGGVADPDRGLSFHEADHLVAAGVAGPDLQLGRAARLRGADRHPRHARPSFSMPPASSGRWATTRSTPTRTRKTTR